MTEKPIDNDALIAELNNKIDDLTDEVKALKEENAEKSNTINEYATLLKDIAYDIKRIL